MTVLDLNIFIIDEVGFHQRKDQPQSPKLQTKYSKKQQKKNVVAYKRLQN